MARYIDADAFLEKMRRTRRYFSVKFDVEEMPTADVVPKRETIEKFLENAKQNGYCLVRAEGLAEDIATYIATKIAMGKTETARAIFAEIEDLFFDKYLLGNITASLFEDKYAELKEKYCGKDTNVPIESEVEI